MLENRSVSFVIPAFNCASTIGESIESILAGNFESGDEIIIVNDGSTDETAQVVKSSAAKNPHILVFEHTFNRGSAAAGRNTAIEHASNPIIFCLDADNILAPSSVPMLKAYMTENGMDAAAFQELWFFTQSPTQISHKWTCKAGNLTLSDALSSTIWPGPSGNYLFTLESWRRAGRYNEFVGGGIDSWVFGIQQLATGSKMGVLERTGYYHRHGHESAWVRNSKVGYSSLKALTALIPYLDSIEPEDVEYLFSREGRYTWFENLDHRPIRMRNEQLARVQKKESIEPIREFGRLLRKWKNRH